MARCTRFILVVLGLHLALSWSTEAQAAPILNIVDGELRGASGVLVGSTLWDVAFVDGTCAQAFDGCDDAASNLAFTDHSDAYAAALALLDQVFLDSPLGMFDSQPELTAGCESVDRCVAIIPYWIGYTEGYGWETLSAGAWNNSGEDRATSGGFLQLTSDLAQQEALTWAVFSNPVPIPEPSTALLIGLGLVGVGAQRRRTRAA